jgi:hypothetical protein
MARLWPCLFLGVPSMLNGQEVKVLYQTDGDEGLAKRKGEITLAARRELKEARSKDAGR